MTPDGSEVLVGETDSLMWRYERILRIRVTSPDQIVIDTPAFVKNFKYENMWMIGEPMISPDNKTLFFVADYPPDYWQARRDPHGDWIAPTKMKALSTDQGDWYLSASKNNTLYFTDGRIHKSPNVNGQHNLRIRWKAHLMKKMRVIPVYRQMKTIWFLLQREMVDRAKVISM